MERKVNSREITCLNGAKILTKSGRYAVIDYIQKRHCCKYICYLKNEVEISSNGTMYNKIFLDEIELILELGE